MSTTTNLGLFKHDNPATNTNAFDVKGSLNDNWDKIDENAGDVNQSLQQQATTISNINTTLTTNLNTAVADLQTQINSVASGSPAGVYATVSDLTTADPDHSKIYVVSADGHWYYYGNNQWNDGGVYQASEDSDTVEQIQSDLNDIRSVTNVTPKNILNPLYKNEGYTRQWNTGAKVTGDYVTFEFIPIELNRNLYFSRGNGTTQSATVCCFDENKDFVSVSGISDSQPYNITNTNVKYISISISLATYNAWKNTLMLEYDTLSTTYEAYFDAYKITRIYDSVLPPFQKMKNKNVCAIAHQGLSDTARYYGDSRLSSILNASKYGFDYCETDLVFSSDNVPVCCHDTTFVDSTTSETIDITSKTYEQLQTYNYYGEKIASFEDVLKTCKLNGMGLFIDHVTEATEGDVNNRISILTQIVQKYNMQNSVKWICGRTSVFTKILEWYKYSTICVNLGNMDGLTSLINTYSQYQTDYNKFIVTLNYSSFSVSDVITIRNTLPPSFDLAIWTIDDKTNYENYSPYCNMILSNKLSPYIIADDE